MLPRLAACVFALSACQPVPVPPAKLGMNPWVGYDPLVLARDQGLLDRTRTKVVELSSNAETLRHFRNGQLDAAALALAETLRLADEGVDVRIVAVLSSSAGADQVLALPEITRPQQLRGRSIAVERSTVGTLMLQRLLRAAGLTPNEVTVHHIEAPMQLAAVRQGQVDAVITFEPMAGALRASGLRPIFDSRQMPGDIVDVLVVHDSLLAHHREQVDAMVLGWRLGLRAMLSEPARHARTLAAGIDLTPDEYLATFKGLKFYDAREGLALMGGRPRALEQQSRALVLTMRDMGLIRGAPD